MHLVFLLTGAVGRADVIRVDGRVAVDGDGSSWDTARKTIQGAVDAAHEFDELWVAGGTYAEAVVVEKPIDFYAGFEGTETSRDARDLAAHETTIDAFGTGRGAVLLRGRIRFDGFTVTGGLATWSGGMHCEWGPITLVDCRIVGNRATDGGGGITCNGAECRLERCTIADNYGNVEGGGMACWWGADVVVADCTIADNRTDGVGAGVFAQDSFLRLENCLLANNAGAGVGAGLSFSGGSQAELVRCRIVKNRSTSSASGLAVRGESRVTAVRCLFSGNVAAFGEGSAVYCEHGFADLIHCTLADNSAASGSTVYCRYASPELVNCVLWNPRGEIEGGSPIVRHCCVQGGWPGDGNVDAHPCFVDPDGGDFRLAAGSSCIDAGSDVGLPFEGTAPDLGAYEAAASVAPGTRTHTPAVLHVRDDAVPGGDGASWETALASLNDAFYRCSTGDSLWVHAGTYAESVVMEPGVAMYGGFDGTTLPARRDASGGTPSVIDASGLGATALVAAAEAVIDGFTITGGAADRGGGLVCHGASPLVTRCTLTGNEAGDGGGLFVRQASPHILECTIAANHATGRGGGVYIGIGGDARLEDCRITGNHADFMGAGVAINDPASPEVVGCTFSANTAGWTGGGASCSSQSTPAFERCAFIGNEGFRGGGVSSDSRAHPALDRCWISQNGAGELGGGLFVYQGTATMVNAVFAGNLAGQAGGAIFCSQGQTTAVNCTIAGNTATVGSAFDSQDGSSLEIANCILDNPGIERSGEGWTIVYSRVFGATEGEGNIGDPPGFAGPWDGQTGDFRLAADSPCLDAGDPQIAPERDFLGVSRPQGRGVDMGAYERPQQPPPAPILGVW